MPESHLAIIRRWLFLALAFGVPLVQGQEAKVLEQEGKVLVVRSGQTPTAAQINMPLAVRDRLGTGEASRAVLQMSARWLARIDEETDVEITPGAVTVGSKDAISVALGGIFVYSREEEGELKIITPSATGGLRGTQLVVRVDASGKTTMQVIEGEVALTNDQGEVLLRKGEAGEAERGKAPQRTAVIDANNLVQWALYYPAVLGRGEMGLSAAEETELAESLAAYQAGDLLGALSALPVGFVARSDATQLYHAAVLLATGRVKASRARLASLPRALGGRLALERMIAAVTKVEKLDPIEPASAGLAVAESYYRQSQFDLEGALAVARRATELDPRSGFAWTRVAELEFSFGRTQPAEAALQLALKLTPRNAQAHALHGFLLTAEQKIGAAQAAFARSIALDGALANGWLGLGLCKIKLGHPAEGRADLQTAATVEPNRSFLFSYHGKALSQAGLNRLARKDLDWAKSLDPTDPTPWLYAAILDQQENAYNEAIAMMQESLRLNDNRQIYRSRFLLDQDRAVRSTNLARIYQNDGMPGLAVRESTRAVENDYTNASAHLFLANSFDALRDPRRLLLRYETAWFNELLLAHLLAPVGGGPLSQYVSQQEFSQLLESDRVGGNLVAEVRDGGYRDVQLSVFGTHGRLSTGLDLLHHWDRGSRINNDSLHDEYYGQVKYQASPDDIGYLLVKGERQDGGDLLLTADNTTQSPGFRFADRQKPGLLLAGWNHRWAPGVNTLFLIGRLAAQQQQADPAARVSLLLRDQSFLVPGFFHQLPNGDLEYASPVLSNATQPPVSSGADGALHFSPDFQRLIAPYLGAGTIFGEFGSQFDSTAGRGFEIYSVELLHIWQHRQNTLLAGFRGQTGTFSAEDRLAALTPGSVFADPADGQKLSADFHRASVYLYDFVTLRTGFTLIGGVSRDELTYPGNFRLPPLQVQPVERARTNWKFGFRFSPQATFALRGIYTESLGGVSFDDSVRLEPVQLAGFNQAFRTIISEALAGSVEAPVYHSWGLSAEFKPGKQTWLAIAHHQLREDVTRTAGVFDFISIPNSPAGFAFLPSSTVEQLDYREDISSLEVNQVLGAEYAVGCTYRHVRSDLLKRLPQYAGNSGDTPLRMTLDDLLLHANWNGRAGWFARGEAIWLAQQDRTMVPAPREEFWQFNLSGGRRFAANRREIAVGILNLTDRDYRLNPLSYTLTPPRGRTFFVRCRVGF